MPKRKKLNTAACPDWPTYDLRFDPDEFRNRLRIDRHALDDEVEQQAELYGEIAEAAVRAKSVVDSLDEQLKELESTLDAEARTEAENNEERITENAIRALVAGSIRRKSMVIQILEARDMQRRLDALATAFRQRSYALRDVVDLYLSSYYSSRSASGAREEHREAEVDRITTRMGERRKKRVKRHRTRLPQDQG